MGQDGTQGVTERRVRQRADRDGTQHAAAAESPVRRLRSRPERVQREGDCAVGQGRREAGSCDHRFEGRRCGVDLVDGAGEALSSALCLPAAELHLDGCPASVGHRQDRIELTSVGVAIVVYVCAQGLRVDEQVVDNCGFKEETERFQVVVR